MNTMTIHALLVSVVILNIQTHSNRHSDCKLLQVIRHNILLLVLLGCWFCCLNYASLRVHCTGTGTLSHLSRISDLISHLSRCLSLVSHLSSLSSLISLISLISSLRCTALPPKCNIARAYIRVAEQRIVTYVCMYYESWK